MPETAHSHIGILEAWELWFQGKDLKAADDILWHIRLIWWGRIGVLAAFLGGLIIVLDIIGDKKLDDFASRWRRRIKKLLHLTASQIASVAGVLLGALGVAIFTGGPYRDLLELMAVIAGLVLIWVFALIAAARLFSAKGGTRRFARYFALAMLIISAYCTLLAS